MLLDTSVTYLPGCSQGLSKFDIEPIPATVYDRQYFDRVWVASIDDPVRPFNELANFRYVEFRNAFTYIRIFERAFDASRNSLNYTLSVDRRRKTYVVRDRAQLFNCLLRPTEPGLHETRRIRDRIRASASS